MVTCFTLVLYFSWFRSVCSIIYFCTWLKIILLCSSESFKLVPVLPCDPSYLELSCTSIGHTEVTTFLVTRILYRISWTSLIQVVRLLKDISNKSKYTLQHTESQICKEEICLFKLTSRKQYNTYLQICYHQ